MCHVTHPPRSTVERRVPLFRSLSLSLLPSPLSFHDLSRFDAIPHSLSFSESRKTSYVRTTVARSNGTPATTNGPSETFSQIIARLHRNARVQRSSFSTGCTLPTPKAEAELSRRESEREVEEAAGVRRIFGRVRSVSRVPRNRTRMVNGILSCRTREDIETRVKNTFDQR